jgi:hypothetical protein
MSEPIDKELVRYHIFPESESEPEHTRSPKCWCSPQLDERVESDVNCIEVWIHNRVN